MGVPVWKVRVTSDKVVMTKIIEFNINDNNKNNSHKNDDNYLYLSLSLILPLRSSMPFIPLL